MNHDCQSQLTEPLVAFLYMICGCLYLHDFFQAKKTSNTGTKEVKKYNVLQEGTSSFDSAVRSIHNKVVVLDAFDMVVLAEESLFQYLQYEGFELSYNLEQWKRYVVYDKEYEAGFLPQFSTEGDS